ncbi:hypothetical protein DFH07DRAFT_816141 [Mycena maculata]|uniref:DUF1996 domain-containing protein n=1 Tax=Mycena maculata TaxID=230809 RepID=A0AAD7JAC7_9AGAR|nr:hypothetical protein DFH07DRAFT_816141 [Mycena maculata]
MAPNILSKLLLVAAVLSSANAYFLFAMNDIITTERIDPIVSPGKVSGHVHTIAGGSNFRVSTNTSYLQQSECTSSPITEDKSIYWAPTLYFQWNNGSFTSVSGSPVIYYLFSDTPGVTTPFPDDFRMLSGTPTLRSYNASDYAQQAVTFLCLDFSGTSTKFNTLPAQECPSGIRAQINFPSCWDGVNTDSVDHKSHVAFLSTGPDSGTCSDPNFPKTLPRVFMEMYLDTASFDAYRDQAMNPSQPFVYSMGDPTGYGYHADFMMGWEAGVLQNVVDKCNCNEFGDPTCCSQAGIFTFTQGGSCRITKGVNETTTGTLDALPGNNPVVPLNGVAQNLVAAVTPALISPVYAYTGDSPTQTGQPVGQPVTASGATTTEAAGSNPTSAGGATIATTTAGATTAKAATTAKVTSTKATATKKAAGTAAPASTPTSGLGSSSGSSSSSDSSSGSGSGSGSGAASSSSSSSSNHSSGSNNTGTCHKKRHSDKRAVRHARSIHESSRRRFASPYHHFTDNDF